MLTYLAIAARLKPRWVVWENVPGVLSSNGGRDFATFLSALGELGYGVAYRVLDAQYVRVGRWPRAVPQRRRRVFVVGRLLERGAGDWTAAAEVLAVREGLQRHLEASGKARKGAPSDAEGGARGGCWWDGGQVSQTLDAVLSKGQTMSEKNRFPAVLQPTAGTLGNRGLRSHTELDGHGAYIPVAFSQNQRSTGGTHGVNQHPEVSPAVKVGSGLGIPSPPAVAHSLRADGFDASEDGTGRGTPLVPQAMTVRRLTPVECERLQGFPDDWTLIPWRKKPAEECPDGPRYKALGNSMACNCMAWIGEKISKWETDHA